jgi:glycosyltransferase involved in cell wall biosynthesis
MTAFAEAPEVAEAADVAAHRRPRPAAADLNALRAHGEQRAPMVDIVIPVYNEVYSVDRSVRRLHAYLSANLACSFRITIADNASTDGTWTVVRYLHRDLEQVAAIRLAEKGRGRALRQSWLGSDAQILAYMDVDLSTDLAGLFPLLAPLISGHSDVSIGTRLARGARVRRGPKRDVISRCYNRILRTCLAAEFSDAQCGFKAITNDAAQLLLPLVQDNGWFFDTELLVLAERAGLRIYEVPVDWVDDPDSRVDILDTAVNDLRGVWRLRRELAHKPLPLAALSELAHKPLPLAELGNRLGAKALS